MPQLSPVSKPFYLRPPWNILFDFRKLGKITPWKINVAYLLLSFLEEMEKRGEVDFRASGVALDSSALIYLMKSKLLLKLEEPPSPPPKKLLDFLPPPLFLPLRHELTSTTIQNLLQVLDEVLKGEKTSPTKPKVEPVLPPPSDILSVVDAYLMEIEAQMEELYLQLHQKVKGRGIINFSRFVAGKERIDAIRIFILLLFLAQKGKVSLWQNEEFGEIYITVGESQDYGADGVALESR